MRARAQVKTRMQNPKWRVMSTKRLGGKDMHTWRLQLLFQLRKVSNSRSSNFLSRVVSSSQARKLELVSHGQSLKL